MNHSFRSLPLILSLLFLLTGCEAVGAIFNVGLYTGIFLVVLIVAVIMVVVLRMRKKD